MILDIHTHNLTPNPEAVIDISALVRDDEDFAIPDEYTPEQRFSVGIHPWWLTEDISDSHIQRVEKIAEDPRVALIGETGIDIPKGGPLFRQMLVFKRMIELSERVEKPLLIHDVKAHDVIIGLHKEMRAKQPWIIHGFRGKTSVAQMLLGAGMWLSFGELFNPITVHSIPSDRILAETDESPLPIKEIIYLLSDARGTDLTHCIAENTKALLPVTL